MSSLLLPVVVLAHVGGIPTQADFQEPRGVGNVVDGTATITWMDNNADPTGLFEFYYQPHNVPPNASLMSGDLVGTRIPCDGSAQCDTTTDPLAVRIMDATDALGWDTSAVPSGSYVVYAITRDPPIQPIWKMARGVITVQHPGDPLYPAAIMTAPGVTVPPVADSFALKWEASGDGPMTATLRWRAKDGGDPGFTELVADVPMSDAGGGLHRGCYVWDVSDKTNGYYFVQVEVKDAAGRTYLANGDASVVVFRDPSPTDAGPAASCEDVGVPDAGPGPDAGGPGGDDEGGEPTCGCRVGRAGSAGGFVVGALLLLGLRRRRRR
jgi:MYXO-CTERM domain-containing protein